MKAADTLEGQVYILPERFGNNVSAIQNGWNYNKEYLLFLLERGKERIIKVVMPNEEVDSVG